MVELWALWFPNAGATGLLIRHDGAITLADHWPDQGDLGRLVILPGGEAGILTAWWHAEDHTGGAGSSSSPTTGEQRNKLGFGSPILYNRAGHREDAP